MARSVDLSAFDKVRSLADYDKAAIEEARQRFMQAQALQMQQKAADRQQQMFDLERQKFEAEKAQPDQMFGGNSFQAQLGNQMKRMGYSDDQIIQALTTKVIGSAETGLVPYSTVGGIGSPRGTQEAPPEPLSTPRNPSARAPVPVGDMGATNERLPLPMPQEIAEQAQRLIGGGNFIIPPTDQAQRARDIEEAKSQAELDARRNASLPGKQRLSGILTNLSNLYSDLDKGGGAVNTNSGVIANVGNYMSNTATGQSLGQMFGTKNQSTRNEIASKIPLISAAIKDATGMSSQQMNSNFELQQYLKALSSPTNDVQSNQRILADLDAMFGMGGQLTQMASQPNNVTQSGGTQLQPGAMQDGYVYMGGDPSSPTSWQKAQ